MVPWDAIRKFLMDTYSVEESGEQLLVSVPCPSGQSQIVCVYVVGSSKVVLDAPFAKASVQRPILVQLLSLLADVSHYGVRQDGDYLLLTTVGVLGGMSPPELDYLMTDLAAKADKMEDLLADGDDNDSEHQSAGHSPDKEGWDETAGWEEIQEFLLKEQKAEKKGDRYFVKFVRPDGRDQLLWIEPVDEARILIESPFAKAAEYESDIGEILPALSAETHFGIRRRGTFLVLNVMVVVGATTLRGIDFLIADVATYADEIEKKLTDGENSF
jgi:hypothetical protein